MKHVAVFVGLGLFAAVHGRAAVCSWSDGAAFLWSSEASGGN